MGERLAVSEEQVGSLTSQLEVAEKDRDIAVEVTRHQRDELTAAVKDVARLKDELSDSKFVQKAQAEQQQAAEERHKIEMKRA